MLGFQRNEWNNKAKNESTCYLNEIKQAAYSNVILIDYSGPIFKYQNNLKVVGSIVLFSAQIFLKSVTEYNIASSL
jgi:hypothetical protein